MCMQAVSNSTAKDVMLEPIQYTLTNLELYPGPSPENTDSEDSQTRPIAEDASNYRLPNSKRYTRYPVQIAPVFSLDGCNQ